MRGDRATRRVILSLSYALSVDATPAWAALAWRFSAPVAAHNSTICVSLVGPAVRTRIARIRRSGYISRRTISESGHFL
jgi:hypothetical protein